MIVNNEPLPSPPTCRNTAISSIKNPKEKNKIYTYCTSAHSALETLYLPSGEILGRLRIPNFTKTLLHCAVASYKISEISVFLRSHQKDCGVASLVFLKLVPRWSLEVNVITECSPFKTCEFHQVVCYALLLDNCAMDYIYIMVCFKITVCKASCHHNLSDACVPVCQ